MGDLSNEPSMEEILSSIKRIIAEEGDAVPRARRASRPVAVAGPDGDEILELSDPMPAERNPASRANHDRGAPERAIPAEHVRAERAPRPDLHPERHDDRDELAAPASRPAPRAGEGQAAMISKGTVDATRGALDSLSRMLVRPDQGSDGTLEGLVREMIRPMVRDWLDANLPALAEELVAREIGRITGSQR